MRIDLDAARAARAEAAGEGPVVVFGGGDFPLPPEMPFSVAESLATLNEMSTSAKAAEMQAIFKALLGENYESFMAQSPSLEDMLALIEGLGQAYGLEDVGESEASPD